MAATIEPAAPVTTTTLSEPSARAGSATAGWSASPMVQRSPSAWPTSTGTGSCRVSSTSRSATVSAATSVLHVDDLDQGVGPFAGQRLGEATERATQGRGGPGRVIAVATTEPGGGDEEGARRADLFGQRPQGHRRQLDPDVQRGLPLLGVEGGERAFVVEGGEPVDALHRAGRTPGRQLLLERGGVRLVLDGEHLDTERLRAGP